MTFCQSYLHIAPHTACFRGSECNYSFFLAEFPDGLLLSLPPSQLDPPEEALNDYQLYR